MGDDFGIGVRREDKSFCLEMLAQGFMILDDAVVHDRDLGQVTREVGMGIAFRGRAMGGPAGMGYAHISAEMLLIRELAELRNATGCAQPLQMAVIERDAGGIVAAIFEAAQTFQQSGHDVGSGDGTDYSAHGMNSLLLYVRLFSFPVPGFGTD